MRLHTCFVTVLLTSAIVLVTMASANQHEKKGKYGPGSTMAGGLLALPPARLLGANVLENAGMEPGATGWYIPRCFTLDSAVSHSGSHSLRYDAGVGCGPFASAPEFVFKGGSPYTFSVWVKSSPGSNLQARIYVFNDTSGTLPVDSTDATSVGTDWTQIVLRDVDVLPLHDGDKLRIRLIVGAPRGQVPSGTLWFDDVTAQPELPLPISTFLLYPNFRGYLWQSGPQQIRLNVSTPNAPTGTQAQIVVQQEGGPAVTTVTKSAAAGEQEIEIDGSKLALGSYLLHENLVDSGGKILASYPDYRVTKVSDAFKNSLVNYVDADNFLVHNGQKEFVWGVYDRMSAKYRCGLCMFTDANSYETRIPGFNGMGTLANYQDTHLNLVTNIAPWSAMSPGAPAVYDYLGPALQALHARGVGYLQFVNNWVSTNRYRPFWARSLSDEKLWKLAGKTMRGKPGSIGYYTFDEPKIDELPTVFDQYIALRENNSGTITYGALINARQIYRWRDAEDAIGCDPYPVGVPINADEYKLGLKLAMPSLPAYEPPMVRVPLWTKETERQVDQSRPVWMVLQLFRQWGKFPTYEQMKYAAYSSIIQGANGILWWGFVSQAGIEAEWANGNKQAYFDFKRLSDEVMGLKSFLIAPSQPKYLALVSSASVATLVKSGANEVVIFASNDSTKEFPVVKFQLAGIPKMPSSVSVYGENRKLPLDSRGNFSDSFAGYQAHVYTLDTH